MIQNIDVNILPLRHLNISECKIIITNSLGPLPYLLLSSANV